MTTPSATDVAWERLIGMWQGSVAALPSVAIGIVLFAVFLAVSGGVKRTVSAVAARAGQPRGVALVLSRMASWGVLALGALVSFTVVVPTLTAANLFGALGFTGVAIGFAFKDIFQNLLAGLLILITRPFRIGDQIVSGEHEGTVENILVRATLLRTYDNRQVVIPNSELFVNRVVVNTAHDVRRLTVELGVDPAEPIAGVKAVVLDVLRGLEGVRQDPPPTVNVRKLGDYATELAVNFWVDPPIRREVVASQDEVLTALHERLARERIDLPYPTRRVLLRRERQEDAREHPPVPEPQ